MRYMMLIYSDETIETGRSQAENEANFALYDTFTNEVRQRGNFLSGEALRPTTTATTVQVQAGKIVTTDGPFAATKEQLGGFFILDCQDLDEAIELAAKIPAAQEGLVEIRPIMELG